MAETISKIEIHHPPEGAWAYQDAGTVVLGATIRSKIGYVVLLFLFFWTINAARTSLTEQLVEGTSNFVTIPIVVFVGLAWWGFAFVMVWGKLEITIDATTCKIFKGVGKLGTTKNYLLDKITIVPNGLVLNGDKVPVLRYNSFAIFDSSKAQLTDIRYKYLLRAICKVLEDRAQNKNFLDQDLEEDLSKHLV